MTGYTTATGYTGATGMTRGMSRSGSLSSRRSGVHSGRRRNAGGAGGGPSIADIGGIESGGSRSLGRTGENKVLVTSVRVWERVTGGRSAKLFKRLEGVGLGQRVGAGVVG